MTTTLLAALIADLTHTCDNLEVAMSSLPPFSHESRSVLVREVATLHRLIDQLNATYEEDTHREGDAVFENDADTDSIAAIRAMRGMR